MKIGSELVIDLTPEQYFEQVEKRILRFFGNHVSQKDAEEGFLETYDTSVSPLRRTSNYNPEGYEIGRNNMVSEEIVPFLSFLNIFNITPGYEGLPDMTEENIKTLSEDTQEKWEELINEHVLPQAIFFPINAVFGDEDRYMAGDHCEKFEKAYDITKNVVLMDDTNDDALAKKEDAIAKLCTSGLKNIMTYVNTSLKVYGVRDDYAAFLTISKILDWLDENKSLKEKIKLNEDEWTYLKGLKALGEVVREGETEYDKFIKDDRNADPEAAERYRKFSYALYIERQDCLEEATKEVNNKLDAMQKVFEKDEKFCEINRLGEYSKNLKNKPSKRQRPFQNCEEMMAIQKRYSNLCVPTVSDIVKRLGKCKSKEEIDDLVRKEAEKAGEIPKNYDDHNSFAHRFGQHHTTDKITEPKEIKPLTNEEIKRSENARNKDLHETTRNFFKGEIKEQAEGIYSEMDLFKNHNKFRGSSPEFRDTKALLEELIGLSKKSPVDRKNFKRALDTLEEKTEKYLNKKDEASGVRRTERNNDSYANRRYNLMLRCSDMVARMKQKEDDVEFHVALNSIAAAMGKEVKLPHPKADSPVMMRGLEYVLCKNSGKTSDALKKELIEKYFDGTLNESKLVAENKEDLKHVNDYINGSVINIRKSCAKNGMSVGESEKLLTKEFDAIFDAAIEKENEKVMQAKKAMQEKKALKNAEVATKDKPEEKIKRSYTF